MKNKNKNKREMCLTHLSYTRNQHNMSSSSVSSAAEAIRIGADVKIVHYDIPVLFERSRFKFTFVADFSETKEHCFNVTIGEIFDDIKDMIVSSFPHRTYVGEPVFQLHSVKGRMKITPLHPVWQATGQLREIRVVWKKA